MGESALARFDQDVLSQPGVKAVIVLMGINDIGWPGSPFAVNDPQISAEQVIAAYKQLIARARTITEGTQISLQGKGYAWTPGIYTASQIAGWRKVAKTVHAKHGRIFAQLWHVGRISHVSIQPGGGAPVAPSPLVVDGVKVFIDPEGRGAERGVGEMVQHSQPEALSAEAIGSVVCEFASAAQNAMDAGFDGVELHGANGYLINQFIDSRSNLRTDEYGGSLRNRLRFLKQVVEAVVKVAGADRVGVRLAPLTTLQGAVDDTPQATYLAAAKILNDLAVAYIHIAEADWDDAPVMAPAFKEALRLIYTGTIIYSGHYTKDRAIEAIENDWADMIGFGRAFIANPDLPHRLEFNCDLAGCDESKFFGGGAEGYTDYPVSKSSA